METGRVGRFPVIKTAAAKRPPGVLAAEGGSIPRFKKYKKLQNPTKEFKFLIDNDDIHCMMLKTGR